MADIAWLPDSWERWADQHGRLHNLPAFAALALPVMFLCHGRRDRRGAIIILAAIAALLELLQYFIPSRTCEWQDIALSWAGLATTWLPFELFCWSVGRWRSWQYKKRTVIAPPDFRAPPVRADRGFKS